MQTFSHKPFIGLPLMFPGHLSIVELLLQKDIFLPPFIFATIYAERNFLLSKRKIRGDKVEKKHLEIQRKFIMILRVFKSKSTEKTAFRKAIIRQKLRFVYSLLVNIIGNA